MGISGLSILFDLLWYVLVFGAAAVMAKWMIELHWTRSHTEYVTELLDSGRLSISERCSRAKTAVASIPEWIATEFNAARRYMAGNMMSVLCLLCVAGPLLLGIAYVKFTPGSLAELVPVSCVRIRTIMVSTVPIPRPGWTATVKILMMSAATRILQAMPLCPL